MHTFEWEAVALSVPIMPISTIHHYLERGKPLAAVS